MDSNRDRKIRRIMGKWDRLSPAQQEQYMELLGVGTRRR